MRRHALCLQAGQQGQEHHKNGSHLPLAELGGPRPGVEFSVRQGAGVWRGQGLCQGLSPSARALRVPSYGVAVRVASCGRVLLHVS